MKSPKFVHVTGLLIFLIYMLVATSLMAQYQPQTFNKQLQTRTIVVGAVNLAYVGYMLVKPSIPLQTQRWLNPLACGVTMGVTFGITINTAVLRKRLTTAHWVRK
jgi:hypothetical protein